MKKTLFNRSTGKRIFLKKKQEPPVKLNIRRIASVKKKSNKA